MAALKTKLEAKLKVLLADHGYAVEGNLLIRKGLPGWSADRIAARVRSLFDAAEFLIPIVCEDEYYKRHKAIVG